MGAATAAYTMGSTTHGNLVDVRSFGVGTKLLTGSVTLSNSYATGGDTMDLSDLFSNLDGVIFGSAGGYTFEYVAGKVKAYYGDYSSAADGVLAEVAAATNLSAITVPFIAFGT